MSAVSLLAEDGPAAEFAATVVTGITFAFQSTPGNRHQRGQMAPLGTVKPRVNANISRINRNRPYFARWIPPTHGRAKKTACHHSNTCNLKTKL